MHAFFHVFSYFLSHKFKHVKRTHPALLRAFAIVCVSLIKTHNEFEHKNVRPTNAHCDLEFSVSIYMYM